MHRVEALVSQLSPSGVAAAKKPSGELVTTIVQQGVAVLSINYPPVNAFNIHIRDAISKAYDAAVANDEVKAIVITGNKTTFMAGADLEYIQAMQNDSSVKTSDILRFVHQSHDLFNKIESGPKPTVAAINGTALGGGLELAMACNARVAVDKAVMGLPELQLGLLPGAGGTQRLPRLIGVQQAVQSTLASRNINAKNALKFGLVDAVVKPAELLQTAGKFALGMVMGKVPRRQSLLLEDKLGEKEDALRIVAGARLQSAGKAKNVPHPFSYLDAVEEGIKNGPKAGIKKEAEGFANLVLTPTAKSLIHFFFASRATSKIPGIPEKPKSPPAKTIAILGAGTMGAGIAIAYLFRGFNVIVKEINQKFLEAGVERIIDNLQRVIKARKLPTLAIEQIMRGLTPQITYDGFDKVDIVIEAALENIPLKQKIFAELESVCSPNAILATNTSTIDVELIGAKTKALDRIVGLHFFSPAHVMPLLEIVRTKHTSNETIARCLQMSKAIGKTPVVSGNCVGFIANRIFFSYGQAAGFLVDAGVDPYRIDKALQSFGMPMGCFRMADLSGIDIFMHVNEIINSAYGQRCYNGTLGAKLSAAKRLGEKTKQGYYKYVNSKPVPDPKGLEPLLAAARADAAKNNVPRIDPSSLTDQQIVEIILFPVVNECTRVVGEGFARTPADVDICAVMGYGFPAYRGGLMFWGASKHKYPGGSGGYKYIRERLAQFSAQYGASNASLKSFFKPSEYLEELAKKSS